MMTPNSTRAAPFKSSFVPACAQQCLIYAVHADAHSFDPFISLLLPRPSLLPRIPAWGGIAENKSYAMKKEANDGENNAQ